MSKFTFTLSRRGRRGFRGVPFFVLPRYAIRHRVVVSPSFTASKYIARHHTGENPRLWPCVPPHLPD